MFLSMVIINFLLDIAINSGYNSAMKCDDFRIIKEVLTMPTAVELSNLEKSAVDLIKSALRENNLPDDPLYFRRTEKYLTVGGNDYIPFIRLKLDKDLWYVSIRCGDPETKKNYLRFEISDVSEIAKYSHEIANAFHTFGDCHARKTAAVRERVLANASHA